MSRITPASPPYEPDVAARLEALAPAGVPPIALFRTFVRNLPMSAALTEWGGYELSKRLSLSLRDRELLIDRTCARCGCEYEWGVHVAFFAERVGLTAEQITQLTAITDAILGRLDPDGKLAAVSHDNLRIRIFRGQQKQPIVVIHDLESGEELTRQEFPWGPDDDSYDLTRVEFAGDGQYLLTSTGDNGNEIYQVLCNYQMRSQGGEGYLRLIEFLPDGNTVQMKSYSPSLNRYLTDPENQFVLTLKPPFPVRGS